MADGVSALGLPGMGQAEVWKGVTGLYQAVPGLPAVLQLKRPERPWSRGVPCLVACTISVLRGGDVPLHTLCLLPHHNAHANEAAGDELVCSELCPSAGDLLSL